jgi:quinol monooxygenase YgiN
MNELVGIGRFKFSEGTLEEFKRLSMEAVEVVRSKDSGTLEYALYFNSDESECIVIERYRDSAALIEHSSNIRHIVEPLFATGWVSSDMLGEPSEELKAMMAGGQVGLYAPFIAL